LPKLFPSTPPITAPLAAPIATPRWVLFVFLTASQPVNSVPAIKSPASEKIEIFLMVFILVD